MGPASNPDGAQSALPRWNGPRPSKSDTVASSVPPNHAVPPRSYAVTSYSPASRQYSNSLAAPASGSPTNSVAASVGKRAPSATRSTLKYDSPAPTRFSLQVQPAHRVALAIVRSGSQLDGTESQVPSRLCVVPKMAPTTSQRCALWRQSTTTRRSATHVAGWLASVSVAPVGRTATPPPLPAATELPVKSVAPSTRRTAKEGAPQDETMLRAPMSIAPLPSAAEFPSNVEFAMTTTGA
mmetsp:Transcript_30046/g.105643  ORF Transcript_30046/g.105643 Transcript_30046/m.105643 type:complete len:239 (+) Transcript_30046:866-1582(+)